jgi:hypothetical protein
MDDQRKKRKTEWKSPSNPGGNLESGKEFQTFRNEPKTVYLDRLGGDGIDFEGYWFPGEFPIRGMI